MERVRTIKICNDSCSCGKEKVVLPARLKAVGLYDPDIHERRTKRAGSSRIIKNKMKRMFKYIRLREEHKIEKRT